MENAFWNVLLLLLLLLLLPLVLFPFLFECTSERFCGPLFFLYSLSALSLHSLSFSLEGRKDNLPLQRKSKKCPLPYTLNLKDETLKNGRKNKEKNNASKTS